MSEPPSPPGRTAGGARPSDPPVLVDSSPAPSSSSARSSSCASATTAPRPLDWVDHRRCSVVAGAAAHPSIARPCRALEAGRRAEAESFARILSGLSRSVSPDAILSAIVDELARATDADHIVVVRRRPDARVLDATLDQRPARASRTRRTLLPIADLEDPVFEIAPSSSASRSASPVMAELGQPVAAGADARARLEGLIGRGGRARADLAGRLGGGAGARRRRVGRAGGIRDAGREGQLVADRIAARVRRGLRAAPHAGGAADAPTTGSSVRSSSRTGPATPGRRRPAGCCGGAADEASAALARAYSHRAAEARASTDALTGLPNRRYFDEFCGLLARRRRSGDAVGVLMIDIDQFKVLNDTHGHATGDEVLRAVGGAIVSAVREDDVPARYGGEEFVVLLRNPGPGGRVRGRRARPRGRGGARPAAGSACRASACRSAWPSSSQADQPIDDLIGLADRALYRAKRAGRDRVVAA